MTTHCSGPAEFNWDCLIAGDRNEEDFQLSLNLMPWDLTGATFKAQGRTNPIDADPAPLTAVITPVDLPRGIITIGWPGDQVRAVLAGGEAWAGYWDLEITVAGATMPDTVLAGTLTAKSDVTR
jgi:hypothetical protein